MPTDAWSARWNSDRLVTGVLAWVADPRRDPERLHALLCHADPRAIVGLETAYRRRRGTVHTVVDPLDPAVAALCTIDRNGYLREKGVRSLTAAAEPYALPFLLLRLNDPVEAVRDRAIAAVDARVTAADPTVLVRLVPVLHGLGTRLRAAPVVRRLVAVLLGTGRAEVWTGARGDDPAVRDGCLRLLATVEPAGAVEEAMRVPDPVLRTWAMGVTAHADPDLQRRLLPLFERDPNPRVRWQALRARTRLPHSEPHLRRARLDPDARVRYLARVSLRALGETGSADVYRSTLADPAAGRDDLVGALAGLADMGGSADAARVAPYLDHPTARVRGEAWRALAALDPDAFAARAGRLRADPSGKVRRLG